MHFDRVQARGSASLEPQGKNTTSYRNPAETREGGNDHAAVSLVTFVPDQRTNEGRGKRKEERGEEASLETRGTLARKPWSELRGPVRKRDLPLKRPDPGSARPKSKTGASVEQSQVRRLDHSE